MKNQKALSGCLYLIVTILVAMIAFAAIGIQDKKEKLSRCSSASQMQIDWINFEIQKKAKDYYITTGYAVKSIDFANVYFVGAVIRGPGTSGIEPAVFSIGGDKDDVNIGLSVNQTARAYSDFPSSDELYDLLGVSKYNHGYDEALYCAEQYK